MENKPNILTVLPTYSRTGVEGTILELKRELKEQKQVNKILKEHDYEEKAQDIANFVKRNEKELDDQLLRLSEIVSEIKVVVTENNDLESNEDKYYSRRMCMLFSQDHLYCFRIAAIFVV